MVGNSSKVELPIENGTYPISIDSSFGAKSSKNQIKDYKCALRYSFKPDSIDDSKSMKLTKKGNEYSLKAYNQNEEAHVFTGLETNSKEVDCLLIYNSEKKNFELHSLQSLLRLNYDRDARIKTVPKERTTPIKKESDLDSKERTTPIKKESDLDSKERTTPIKKESDLDSKEKSSDEPFLESESESIVKKELKNEVKIEPKKEIKIESKKDKIEPKKDKIEPKKDKIEPKKDKIEPTKDSKKVDSLIPEVEKKSTISRESPKSDKSQINKTKPNTNDNTQKLKNDFTNDNDKINDNNENNDDNNGHNDEDDEDETLLSLANELEESLVEEDLSDKTPNLNGNVKNKNSLKKSIVKMKTETGLEKNTFNDIKDKVKTEKTELSNMTNNDKNYVYDSKKPISLRGFSNDAHFSEEDLSSSEEE